MKSWCGAAVDERVQSDERDGTSGVCRLSLYGRCRTAFKNPGEAPQCIRGAHRIRGRQHGDNVRDIGILTGRRLRNTASGFTLLELLVVVAIIGLLASYVGPKYFSQIGKSERVEAKAQIESFAKALDQMRLDIGRYPTTAEGLKSLMEAPPGIAKWSGPYLSKALPLDPWGRAYIYKSPGTQGRDYDIISYGSDGQPGGTDAAADVTN